MKLLFKSLFVLFVSTSLLGQELIKAIQNNDSELIKKFIDSDSDFNVVDSISKLSAFELLFQHADSTILKYFIETKKHLDRLVTLRLDNRCNIFLYSAAFFLRWDLLKYMITNSDYTHTNIINLIDYLSYKSRKDLIPKIIDSIDAKINYLDQSGQTLLTTCLKNPNFFGLYQVIFSILENKIYDPNCVDVDGKTALIYAIISGRQSTVARMLNLKNIDATVLDHSDNSALDYAVSYQNIAITKALLNRKDIHGMLLQKKGNKLFENLHDLLAEPIIKKMLIKKSTALFLQQDLFDAIKSNDIFYFRILIKSMSMNVYDEHGNNPMHYAIRFNRFEILAFLLIYATKLLYLPNDKNITPIDLAIYNIKNLKLMLELSKLVSVDNSIKRAKFQ